MSSLNPKKERNRMIVNAKNLEIVKHPSEILFKKCTEVNLSEDFNKLKEISDRMLELMKLHNGIGLASNQVGLDLRMFVVYIPKKMKAPKVCINPEIEHGSVLEESEEGCLSEPGLVKKVKRHKYIIIKYIDINGKPVKEAMRELEARCAQHEIDHLNGIPLSSK